MRTILHIALLALIPSAQAATVYGNLQPTLGTNKVTSVTVKAANGSYVLGTNWVFGTELYTTSDTNGYFSFSAIQGDYNVTIADRQNKITIPDSTNSFNIIDLLASGSTYIYRTPGALVKASTNDTIFGFLNEKLAAGSLITVTESGTTNRILTVALDSAVTSSIAGKVPLTGGTMTGSLGTTILTTASMRETQGSLTHAGTVTLDLSTNTINSLSLTGALTLATANLGTGRTYRLLVTGVATNAALTLPSWIWIGTTPTQVTASKVGRLDLESWGAADSNVIARYLEQP